MVPVAAIKVAEVVVAKYNQSPTKQLMEECGQLQWAPVVLVVTHSLAHQPACLKHPIVIFPLVEVVELEFGLI